MNKTCTKCGEEKLLSEYHKAKKGKYGRAATCKACVKSEGATRWRNSSVERKEKIRVRLQEWRKNNPEKHKAQFQRIWADPEKRQKRLDLAAEYRKIDPEKKLEARRKEYRENPIPHLARGAAYRLANSEKVAAVFAKWSKNNPDYFRRHRKANPDQGRRHLATRRAKLLQRTPPWVELDKIKQVYEKASELQTKWGVKLHVDHVVPLQGKKVSGLHCWENLQILLATENQIKHAKFLDEGSGWLYSA